MFTISNNQLLYMSGLSRHIQQSIPKMKYNSNFHESFQVLFLVQLIEQPILRIPNFNFLDSSCCKVFLFIFCGKSYIGIFDVFWSILI